MQRTVQRRRRPPRPCTPEVGVCGDVAAPLQEPKHPLPEYGFEVGGLALAPRAQCLQKPHGLGSRCRQLRLRRLAPVPLLLPRRCAYELRHLRRLQHVGLVALGRDEGAVDGVERGPLAPRRAQCRSQLINFGLGPLLRRLRQELFLFLG